MAVAGVGTVAAAAASAAGKLFRMLWVLRLVEERFHRDDEGRPLREGRTPPELLRPGEIEYRTCPYSGSRFQHAKPMNASAMKQTGAHWDEIVDTLALLRTSYTEARGGYGPDLMDLWRVSQLGSALPWFFILRGETSPAYAAALAKATLGTGILTQFGACKLFEGWAPPALTSASVLALAEEWHTMIGPTEVCSASANMIVRFLEPLLGEPSEVKDLGGLAARRGELMRFGAAYIAFKHAMWVYYHARRFLYVDVARELGEPVFPQIRELMSTKVEPPDCFRVEPPDLDQVPPPARAAWLHQLASLMVPLSPDGSDRVAWAASHRMADVLGEGLRPEAAYAQLDQLWATVLLAVEIGLRGEPVTESFDEDARDRVLFASPRDLFASLAGRSSATSG